MCESDQFVPAFNERLTAQAIKSAVKHEVLKHGQFVIERKLLRHVTDKTFDLIGLPGYVESGDACASIAGFEQPAKHANNRGFAGPVWPQKTEDRAFGDFETDMINRREMTKTARQPVALDHRFTSHFDTVGNVTSAAMPARSFPSLLSSRILMP